MYVTENLLLGSRLPACEVHQHQYVVHNMYQLQYFLRSLSCTTSTWLTILFSLTNTAYVYCLIPADNVAFVLTISLFTSFCKFASLYFRY